MGRVRAALAQAQYSTVMTSELFSRILKPDSSIGSKEARLAREDLELIQRAIGGDSRAFAALCEPHRERVWRIAAGIAGGSEAEDLAQEAFLKAFRSLRTYRGDASFQAWLSRIALNVAHDFQRSSWRRWVIVWND